MPVCTRGVTAWTTLCQAARCTSSGSASAGTAAASGRAALATSPAEIGLAVQPPTPRGMLDWRADALVMLADLGRIDVDTERRRVLSAATYSLAALALPPADWWTTMTDRGRLRRPVKGRVVGRADLDAVQDMVALFSQVDQRRGGGHARTAVVQYLTTDVAALLCGCFADDRIRQDMFTASAELAYLSGWMAFDNAEHTVAVQYYHLAVKLAAEANNPAMAGHVLRAMAHQAIDLGHRREALELATAATQGSRYASASPRERALLGVVLGRALAANGQGSDAAKALLRAEDDLAAATPDDAEPGRVFFFGEASLAHETACALRDTGDLVGATREFRRSVRTRKALAFARTHAVTLGYLGSVHAQRGDLAQACATWSRALDAMDGVRSGRTRQAAAEIRATLAPLRQRGSGTIAGLDERAATYLATFA